MKIFFLFSWILDLFQWTPFNSNPVEGFFQGLIGACGISVLYNLMRIYNFVQSCSDSDCGSKPTSSNTRTPLRREWRASLQFWCLTALLSLVGLRVSSLIVLEFLLRAAFACMSTAQDSGVRGLDFLLIQCQFSLGCSLTCVLAFLHQGAPHSALGLSLAAALSWAVASYCSGLWAHVARLYPLHSRQQYCGKCISLLTSGHTMLASLQRLVILTFAVAAVASTSVVYEHFLSHKDAIKFWTPLTLCYTMVVVYNQEIKLVTDGVMVLFDQSARVRAAPNMGVSEEPKNCLPLSRSLLIFVVGSQKRLMISMEIRGRVTRDDDDDDDEEEEDDTEADPFLYNKEQHRLTVSETLLRTVVVRLGGLLVLMLTVGTWSDVLHVLVSFIGEGVCLLSSGDLLQAALEEEQNTSFSKEERRSSPNTTTGKFLLDDS